MQGVAHRDGIRTVVPAPGNPRRVVDLPPPVGHGTEVAATTDGCSSGAPPTTSKGTAIDTQLTRVDAKLTAVRDEVDVIVVTDGERILGRGGGQRPRAPARAGRDRRSGLGRDRHRRHAHRGGSSPRRTCSWSTPTACSRPSPPRRATRVSATMSTTRYSRPVCGIAAGRRTTRRSSRVERYRRPWPASEAPDPPQG